MSIQPPVGPLELEERQRKLDAMLKDFIKKGGKIEIIPPGMTGEMYRENQKGTKKKKGRKSRK